MTSPPFLGDHWDFNFIYFVCLFSSKLPWGDDKQWASSLHGSLEENTQNRLSKNPNATKKKVKIKNE